VYQRIPADSEIPAYILAFCFHNAYMAIVMLSVYTMLNWMYEGVRLCWPAHHYKILYGPFVIEFIAFAHNTELGSTQIFKDSPFKQQTLLQTG